MVGSLYLTTQDTSYIAQTVIDGDSNGSVVTFMNGENQSAILSGFTISNGNAVEGGGIYIYNSSPYLSYLSIENNYAETNGGGIRCYGSSQNFHNLNIENNVSDGDGGGIYAYNSTVSLYDSKLHNNSASSNGAAIWTYSTIHLHNTEIFLHTTSAWVIFVDNGNLICYDSNIYYNHGNLFWFKSSGNLLLENSIIHNNSNGTYLFYVYGYSGATIINTTITYNDFVHLLYLNHDVNVNINNSIIWSNNGNITFHYGNSPNALTVSYSDIEDGIDLINYYSNGIVNWLEGNIDFDPLFVDTTNANYNLQQSSPCIDAGDPDSPYDPDGTITDMGAYYFHQVEYGCTDPNDCNYNLFATEDDGSCSDEQFDECGVCGGDNSSCVDCAGMPNGDAELDECGLCGGDGIADGACDCDGNVDAGCGCGEAGPSGCDNACGSSLENDECGVCDGDNSTCLDCAGVIHGTSIVNDCGVCGECDDYTNPSLCCDDIDNDYKCDCNDDCVGEYDECGVCDGGGIQDGECDCDGNVLDECGVCGGPGAIYECGCTNIPMIDNLEIDLLTFELPPFSNLTGSVAIEFVENSFLDEGYEQTVDVASVTLILSGVSECENEWGQCYWSDDTLKIYRPEEVYYDTWRLFIGSGIWFYIPLENIEGIDLGNDGWWDDQLWGDFYFHFETNENIDLNDLPPLITSGDYEIYLFIEYLIQGVQWGDYYSFGDSVDLIFTGITPLGYACDCAGNTLDECGECGGDNFSCTDDCGIINGNNLDIDECGECFGNGYDMCDSDNDGISNLEDWGYGAHDIIVTDIPNDQGGRVYIEFIQSFYDTDTLRSTESYQIERLDDEQWVAVATQNAYDNSTYMVEATTLSNNDTTQFRVVASMNEGNFVCLENGIGESIDNIDPAVPTGLTANMEDELVILHWDEPIDADFQYFTIYRNDELIEYTIQSSYSEDVFGEFDYYITATDSNGNESEVSESAYIQTYISGDINYDGVLDILDVVTIINYILPGDEWNNGNPPSEEQTAAADVNGDGVVDILDIVTLIQIILPGL